MSSGNTTASCVDELSPRSSRRPDRRCPDRVHGYFGSLDLTKAVMTVTTMPATTTAPGEQDRGLGRLAQAALVPGAPRAGACSVQQHADDHGGEGLDLHRGPSTPREGSDRSTSSARPYHPDSPEADGDTLPAADGCEPGFCRS